MPDWINRIIIAVAILVAAWSVLSIPLEFFMDRRCSACRRFSKRRTGASRGGSGSRTESEFKCKYCGQTHWTIDAGETLG